MKWGEEHPNRHDLLRCKFWARLVEPINPEAWMWYHRVIGHERCPIVDTWWQTETGGHMITPLPCATPTVQVRARCRRLELTRPSWIKMVKRSPWNWRTFGIRQPWPGMLRGIYGDRERFIDTYWSRLPGLYFAGDGARRDERGYFWIMGRVMTSSMFRATAWAPWKSKVLWFRIPPSWKRRSWACPTKSRARGSPRFAL